MLNVLSIGSDRSLFDKNAPARRRVISYGHLADQLHIIVFAKKSLGLKAEQISNNTWIYPTNSKSKFSYIGDAIRLGLRLGKFNLVTTQDPFESGWAGWRLSRKLKARLHVQLHTDFLSPYFKSLSLKNSLRVILGKFILKRAKAIRVVSSRIRLSLEKLNLKISPDVLPVFVDPERLKIVGEGSNLRHKYSQFSQIVLSNTRIEKEKNLKMAILAFKNVLNDYPNLGYIIVGDGSLRKELENFVQKEKLEEKIVFVGWQSEPKDYYRTADIYLSSSDYEGYGLSMLEAVLLGLPVVSTDVGIAGDAILHNINALICPARNQECIEKSLKELLGDKNKLALFRENNKKIADNLVPQFQYKYFENYRKSWLKATY